MSGPRFKSLFVLVLLSVPLFVAGEPASGQSPAAGQNLVVTDPVGDVGPFGLVGIQDNPAAVPWSHIDITRLEVGNEAAATYQVILGVAGFDDPAQYAAQAAAVQDFRCSVRWTYDHDEDDVNYYYDVGFSADLLRLPGPDPGAISMDWYWRYSDGDSGRSYSYGGWDAGDIAWDAAQQAFVMTIPKAWVPVWPGGHDAGRGDTLLPIAAQCWSDIALYGNMSDYLGVPEGTGYSFRMGGRGDVIQLGFDAPGAESGAADPHDWDPPVGGETAAHVASVAAGRPSKVLVHVANNADARKLVQLAVTPIDTPSTAWNLSLAQSVMVPARETRIVNLIVTAPASAAPGETLPFAVQAKAAGEPLESSLSGVLRVTPVLSAEHNTFHIHSARYSSANPINQAAYAVFPPYELAASLLETEPGFDDEPATLSAVSGFSGNHYLEPLVAPVRLDATKPVPVTVAFEGDGERSVRVRLYLMAEDLTLLQVDETVPGDGVTEIEAWLNAEDVVEIDAGTELYFQMSVTPSGIGPENANDVAFLARDSSFTLPVMAGGQSLVYTDGRFLPSLALARGEESTTYLNPGKEYAFDLVLSNEGIETDDIQLSVNATNATGWDVTVQPGSVFRVHPGNSTPFSVVVRAADGAGEGDRALFDVIARSKHNDAVRTEVRLDVLVTTGIDVEEKRYEEKEGQLDPLLEERAESPGASLVAVLVAAAAAVLMARRRT